MRSILICSLVLACSAGCSMATTPAGDAGPPPDVGPRDAWDRSGCLDVADAYETARARLGCSYDWPNCPRTISNAECVDAFPMAVSCGHLDTIASRCSL